MIFKKIVTICSILLFFGCIHASEANKIETLKPKTERLHEVFDLDEVIAQRRLGNYEYALTLLQDFFKTHQNSYEIGWGLLEKALLLQHVNRIEEALDAENEVILIHGSSDPTGMLLNAAFYEKSKTLARRGKYDEAIVMIEQAINQLKEIPFPCFDVCFREAQMSIRLGRYYRLAGAIKISEKILRKAMETVAYIFDHTTNIEKKRLAKNELVVVHQELAETYRVYE
jgi:tetratricopeptide (TPR) repeat protein